MNYKIPFPLDLICLKGNWFALIISSSAVMLASYLLISVLVADAKLLIMIKDNAIPLLDEDSI